MCAFKAIIIVYLFTNTVLITSSKSNAKQLRLTARQKALSSYRNYIDELFSGKSIKRKARHLSFKNNTPSGRMKVQLYCKTRFLLEILDNGKIAGTKNSSSPHTIIEIQIFGRYLRRLKGVASGRYLSLNNRGRLFSTPHFHQNTNTFFNENYEENYWCSYSSSLHPSNSNRKKDSKKGKEWFIAIKKNGSLRRPCKTEPGMQSTLFVAYPIKREAVLVDNVENGV